MAQTAVEWLEQEIRKLNIKVDWAVQDSAIKILEQAKQMEREQKKQFWVDGNNTQRCNSTKETDECFDNYYTQTYGK